ncbi:MAG: hypothetical protein ACXWLH_06800 [Candidatus Saccharimonadales bacterium]
MDDVEKSSPDELNPYPEPPDEHADLPLPTEAIDAELTSLRAAQPIVVSLEIGREISRRLPTTNDIETAERIARDCRNDLELAGLLLDLERLEHNRTHPAANNQQGSETYKAKKQDLQDRITRRQQELDQQNSSGTD